MCVMCVFSVRIMYWKGAITLKPPVIFRITQRWLLIRWHCPPKLGLVESAIWWSLLWLHLLWQTPSNSSLDWASVGVTLGPDSEVSVWALVGQCWGITLGQGLKTSVSDEPRKSPGGKAYVEGATGGWDSGICRYWLVSVRGYWAKLR